MTRTLVVGDTSIPYRVRESDRATRKRIVATPDGIEVVVPRGAPIDDVVAFVEGRRRWVFDAQRGLAEAHRERLQQRYGSGAKLAYRGRELLIDMRPADVREVVVTVRSRFHVEVPGGMHELARLEAVREALGAWLRLRALREVERAGRRHAAVLGVEPEGYRLSESRTRWGSCGQDGVIRVHWELIQGPAAALDYVVAHEVAHLLDRHHGPGFWSTLARAMPDWAARKELLERWETGRRRV